MSVFVRWCHIVNLAKLLKCGFHLLSGFACKFQLFFIYFLLEPKFLKFRFFKRIRLCCIPKYLFVFMFVCHYLYVQLYLTQFNKPSNKPPARQAKPKVSLFVRNCMSVNFQCLVSLCFFNFCECFYIMYIDRVLVRELLIWLWPYFFHANITF